MKIPSHFLLVALLFLSLILISPGASAQVTLYTTFGPGQSSNTGGGYAILGVTPKTQWVATPVFPSATAQLHQIDVAAVFTPDPQLSLTNQLQVQLRADLVGQPGAVLESWSVINLPAADSATVTTLKSLTHATLSKGSTYWLVLGPGPLGPDIAVGDGWNLTNLTSGTTSLNGTVLVSPDGASWSDFGCCPHNDATLPAFDVLGKASGFTKLPYTYPSILQILHLVFSAPANPLPIPPGGPIEAILGFVDSNGNAIGPSSQVSVTPGQDASLDFDVSSLVKTLGPNAGVAILPVVSPIQGDTGFNGEVQASVEISDKILGVTTVLVPGSLSLVGAPVFVPMGLAAGQSIRITVFSFPPDPCVATIGFADSTGAPIGQALPVNLNPGQSSSLTLNFDTLNRPAGAAGRVEIQPLVTLTPPSITSVSLPGANACPASVQVLDNLLGRTMTYQSGLPAVQ